MWTIIFQNLFFIIYSVYFKTILQYLQLLFRLDWDIYIFINMNKRIVGYIKNLQIGVILLKCCHKAIYILLHEGFFTVLFVLKWNGIKNSYILRVNELIERFFNVY